MLYLAPNRRDVSKPRASRRSRGSGSEQIAQTEDDEKERELTKPFFILLTCVGRTNRWLSITHSSTQPPTERASGGDHGFRERGGASGRVRASSDPERPFILRRRRRCFSRRVGWFLAR